MSKKAEEYFNKWSKTLGNESKSFYNCMQDFADEQNKEALTDFVTWANNILIGVHITRTELNRFLNQQDNE